MKTALQPQKKQILRLVCILLALSVLLLPSLASLVTPVSAEDESVFYLGDHPDRLVRFEGLEDSVGMNTSHSGEKITIGSRRYEKGLGLHCLPDRNAYMEFDISGLGMNYFSAWVGMLKEASFFMEWGCASFYVYGDGVLLAQSPAIKWAEEPYHLVCDVSGVSVLRLEQNNEGSHACDSACWGDAMLSKNEIETESETEAPFDMNKTDLPQPDELIAGDYAYVSDLYWTNNDSYSTNVVRRDANTCNEEIWDADMNYYPKGIGLHAKSGGYDAFVEFNIDGLGYTKLATAYGVCETLSAHDISMASVKCAVFADGQMIFESDTMTYGQSMGYVELDITGAKVIRLAIAGVPTISGAWGTFGGTLVSKSGNVTPDMIRYIEPETETIPETDPETQPETQPETKPETQLETKPETQPETAPVTVPESDTEVTPETDPATDPVTNPTTDGNTAKESDVATDTQTAAPSPGCKSTVGTVGLLALVMLLSAAVLLTIRARKGRA